MPAVMVPNQIKKTMGTFQPFYANPHEPEGELKYPEMPKNLRPIAEEKWKELSKNCMDMKILTNETRTILETTANVYCDMRELREKLNKEEVGSILWMKWQIMMRNMEKNLIGCLQKLGLTPADRQRVSAIDQKDVKKINDFGKFNQ